MPANQHFDVVIVGAGIAGSAMAAGLSGHGLSIAIVEAQSMVRKPLPAELDLQHFDARVSALTPRSVQFLQGLDAWASVADYRQCPYQHMTVWDAEGTGEIDFAAAELNVPALGHIVENRAIVDALLQRVEAAKDIQVFSPDTVTACERDDHGAMQVTLGTGAALTASLVIGADGAMSRVREMCGFRTREWDYGHRAIVCTVMVARPHTDTAWQRFLPTGPLAFLPLPGKDDAHYCSVVWSLQDSAVESILELDDAAFCEAIADALEHRLGDVLAASPRFAFPLRQRHAVDYVQPGVALVADAAHTIHPLAGQGINLGLRDVAVLVEEVLSAHGRAQAPGELDVLRRYQRRRKGENLLMMGAMDGFKRLFEQRSLPLRWLRNAGMRGVAQVAPVKQRLMRHAMGID